LSEVRPNGGTSVAVLFGYGQNLSDLAMLAALGATTTAVNLYWIARLRRADPERYRTYEEATCPIVAQYGGCFMVRGGQSEVVECVARSSIFPDIKLAREVSSRKDAPIGAWPSVRPRPWRPARSPRFQNQ
jgi:uncharacterized protein (DUF1330 family)